MKDTNHYTGLSEAIDRFMPYYFRFINPVIHQIDTDEFSLNMSQVKVLMAIYKKQKLSPVEISRIFLIPKTSLTTIIRSLIQLGLIDKEKRVGDPRKFTLHLTERGKTLIEEKKRQNALVFSEVFPDMTSGEAEQITRGLLAVEEFFIARGRQI